MDIQDLYTAIDYAIESVRQHLSAQQREREWWKTYRAALPAAAQRVIRCNDRDFVSGCDHFAGRIANAVHGPLKQEAIPEQEAPRHSLLDRAKELVHAATYVSMWAETKGSPFITHSQETALLFDDLKNCASALEDAYKQEAQPTAAGE